MRYLSFDLEATGLEEDAIVIEFAMVPFCTESMSLENNLARHFTLKCPSFDQLAPKLNPWVKENNKSLIEKSFLEGISIDDFKAALEEYISSKEIKKYFSNQKIMLFGKSISAIDLPFMNRDLGWEWMNKHFHHRNLDLSCYTLGLIDMGFLEKGMDSGSKLMNFLEMGEVSHTALEDAQNTALMYFKLLEKFKVIS